MPHRLVTLVVAGCLACSLAFANAAPQLERMPRQRQSSSESDASNAAVRDDTAASRETLWSLRTAGTAMMAWLTDAIGEAPALDARADPLARARAEAAASAEKLEWSLCPPISYQELQAILADTYLQDLPRVDGWGHEIEYCLDRTHFTAVLGVIGGRSPGRDGVFEQGALRQGPFGLQEYDRDIVWLDGLFVAWPQSSGR
jgi:hypothetical protein